MTTSNNGAKVTKYNIAWASDASGNVNTTTFDMKSGSLVSVEFIPGAGGSQPTDLYDVDMRDEHGVSMFDNGAGTSIGANLSNALASHALPLFGLSGVSLVRRWHQGGPVELQVASAGNAKSGTVNVYVLDGVI